MNPYNKGKVYIDPLELVYNSYIQHYVLSHIPTLQMEKKKHREATHNVHGCTAVCAITGFKFRPACLKDHFSQLYHTGLHGNAVARIPESPHSLYIFL